ncbi:TonB-dependent receptor [Prolixibacter sp. SD074]|nr:TonB-dependent receptor [Prolixibacter sp. SD074]
MAGKSVVATSGVVKGTIVEAGTKTPMEYANVVIYSARDSSIVGGIMTEPNGSFQIKNIPPGRYYLQANFIGFEKYTLPGITISRSGPVANIGTLELKPASKELQSIDVVADKARVEFKLDRKIVNVSQDLNSAGGTAAEALENTPSVQVDMDGNVTLRGSSDFTVLIDGKPSVLKGSDALQQIPASNIENIEIITNPSAKYDPDGVSGIINVVMKKNIKGSLSGIVNATTNLNDRNRVNATVNMRSGKWKVFVNGSYQDMIYAGKRKETQYTYQNDSTTVLSVDGSRNRKRTGKSIQAGFDYYASDKSTLSLSGSYGNYGFDFGGVTKESLSNNYNDSINYFLQDNVSNHGGKYWNTDLSYQLKFNKKGHQLLAAFIVSGQDGNDNENQNTINTNADWVPLEANSGMVRSAELSNSNDYRAKLDYTLPINDRNEFDAGYQGRREDDNQDFLFERYVDGNWVNDENFSSTTVFRRDIHAIYATYGHTSDNFSYMLGMRGEYTNRRITYAKTGQDYIIDRFDYFPSVHVSQKFSRNLELQASYSRRLDRPRGYWLDPFPSYIDPYNIRVGNPGLKPQYTDSYELSVIKRIDRSFISLEGYYRRTTNLMTRITKLGEDGIRYQSIENMNNDYSTGAELMANLQITPWFTVVASGTLYNYQLKGTLNNEPINTQSTNFDSRLNLDFKITKSTRFQFMSHYRGPSTTVQGQSDWAMFSNASLRQEFWDKKLSATIQLRDVFGTMRHSGYSYGTGFRNEYKYSRSPRILQFTISYKLNNFKQKEKENVLDNSGTNTGVGDY